MGILSTALVVGVIAFGAGWLLATRRALRVAQRAVGTTAGPHLLPEPALKWLRAAYGALGVWLTELDIEEGSPSTERVIDAERLPVSQVMAVDRRLERARDQEQNGVEQMEGGTLVFRAHGGFAVGLLLAEGADAGRLGEAAADLDRLLEGLRRRPQILALAQAHADEGAIETVASVGLRLAYQLERATGAAVIVAAWEAGGVRVVGASGRADRRLLDTVVAPEAELARVATGKRDRLIAPGDPVGASSGDRRHGGDPVLLLPLTVNRRTVGAVGVWLPGGAEPRGAVLAEIVEAIGNAAPRLSRALEVEALQRSASYDALTGLVNVHTLETAMRRDNISEGAIVYVDVDQFKQLNDRLGHPAGDAALMHIGRLIREQLRAGDTAARIGGEEFAVWLPGAGLDAALRIAERIRLKINTTPWDWQKSPWPLAASFGVAACPETSRRVDNLRAQADSALYVAKHSGKNRVEAAARLDRK